MREDAIGPVGGCKVHLSASAWNKLVMDIVYLTYTEFASRQHLRGKMGIWDWDGGRKKGRKEGNTNLDSVANPWRSGLLGKVWREISLGLAEVCSSTLSADLDSQIEGLRRRTRRRGG